MNVSGHRYRATGSTIGYGVTLDIKKLASSLNCILALSIFVTPTVFRHFSETSSSAFLLCSMLVLVLFRFIENPVADHAI